MARHRLAVALLCPPGVADAVDTLRRALGAPEPFRVPAHLTLVPPLNVRSERRDEVAAVLRAAAAAVAGFELRLGPTATFWPGTATVHLAVDGDPGDLLALAGLRGRLRAGPLDRPDTFDFVPHVTLVESFPPDDLGAALGLLAGAHMRWEVTAVHLLEQRERPADGRREWVPVAEEPLGGPASVGRGGPEVVLRTVGMVEAAAAGLCGVEPAAPGRSDDGRCPLAVVAEDPGAPGRPVGAAVGRWAAGSATLDALVVAPGHRGEGRGAHLLAAFAAAAAQRGAPLVVAQPGDDAGAAFLERHGFSTVGRRLVRSRDVGGDG